MNDFFRTTIATVLVGGLTCTTAGPAYSQEDANADDVVGLWKLTEVCQPAHYDDHKPSGSHANEDAWYAVYKKRMDDGEQIYGLFVSEEFSTLRRWNEYEFKFTPGKYHTGAPCSVAPLGAARFESISPVRLHTWKKHKATIFLHKHGSKVHPLISFDHDGGGNLHKGIVH